ncbi:FAD-dependent monooxygenase [Nakamurella lactea]|uniref:FAD-dependent monooxygenase n=1 Tax=Nakamurella lactea TaxID=459515 RepID=UPI00040C6B15|nr:FAD-dependent monooxygenase [Nakamurella lactea]
MKGLRVLICGASIAGTSLAYWLDHYGAEVTVVERAPGLRPGGQAVDFKGATHRRVLQQMGVLADIERRQTGKTDLRVVDETDSEQAVIPGEFIGGDVEILRGDLGDILYSRTADHCQYLFGDTITDLRDSGTQVLVTFETAPPQSFDLVLGADGIHSRVRRLAFGPEVDYLRHLGYYYAVAGATVGDPAASGSADAVAVEKERSVGLMYNVPGRLALLGGSKAPELYVFAADPLDVDRGDITAQKALLRRRYGDLGWRVPEMLARLDDADDFFFDSIARVQMDGYTKGRVALVGDSAYGNTLGGFGTGLAMVGAYVLAGELAVADGDHRVAFERYDAIMHPYAKIARKGNAGPFMAPKTKRRIRLRNWTFTNRLSFRLMMKMTDNYANDVELRDYPAEVERL